MVQCRLLVAQVCAASGKLAADLAVASQAKPTLDTTDARSKEAVWLLCNPCNLGLSSRAFAGPLAATAWCATQRSRIQKVSAFVPNVTSLYCGQQALLWWLLLRSCYVFVTIMLSRPSCCLGPGLLRSEAALALVLTSAREVSCSLVLLADTVSGETFTPQFPLQAHLTNLHLRSCSWGRLQYATRKQRHTLQTFRCSVKSQANLQEAWHCEPSQVNIGAQRRGSSSGSGGADGFALVASSMKACLGHMGPWTIGDLAFGL